MNLEVFSFDKPILARMLFGNNSKTFWYNSIDLKKSPFRENDLAFNKASSTEKFGTRQNLADLKFNKLFQF